MENSTSCWNWPERVLCITCLIPCNFLQLLARCRWCFRRFLRATTVAYYCHWHRHDGARSQVIDTKPSTSGFNMPIYRCGLKPDKFRHANENRISDPGLTCINSGPGYWVRSSSVNMTLAGKTHRDRFVPDLIQYGTLCLFMWSKVIYQCQRPSEVKLWDGLKV